MTTFTPDEIRAMDLALSELYADNRRLLVRLAGPRQPLQPGDARDVRVLREIDPPLVVGWAVTPWGRKVAERILEIMRTRAPRKGARERRQTATEAGIAHSIGAKWPPGIPTTAARRTG